MKLKKIMALMLAFCMVFSTMSFNVFAEDDTIYVAQIGDEQFETVLDALTAAMESPTETEVKLLQDSTELLPIDFEFIVQSDVVITSDTPVTVEFYNEGTSYDLIFGSENNNTVTIGDNVTLKVRDRNIWLGYYGNKNVTVKVYGTLSAGYQLWSGSDVEVYGTIESLGEALVLRRGKTLTVDGGKVDANYFSILAGNIDAKNDAVIECGPVWISNTVDYVHEGNVEIALDNATLTSSSNLKSVTAHADGVSITIKNGSTASFSPSDHGESQLDESTNLVVSGNSTQLNINSLTNNGTIEVTNGGKVSATGTVTNNGTIEVENEDGFEGVVSGNQPEIPTIVVATVEGEEFTDIQEAIVAAAPRGTVEIKSDITVDKWIMISQSLSIGSGQIITLDEINGLTINGNDHTLTINSIESASNGNRLFYDATNLNIKDLTIKYADGVVGGIGLTSGVIQNVTFEGGVGVLPGTGDITITGCTFKTSGSAIYNEEERDNLNVTGNYFETAEGQYAIYLRGNTTFTGNTVVTGKVNVTNSATGEISGNDFGEERFKVYNGATATISNNTINNLVFNDESKVNSTFNSNTLSEEAQAVLDAATAVAEVNGVKYPTLAQAAAAANAGDEIVLVADAYIAEGTDVTIPGGVTLNGNGFAVYASGADHDTTTSFGYIVAGGDLTIKGVTKVEKFSASHYNHIITIGEGASLEVFGKNRVSLGYGSNINVTGTIADAKTADKTQITPSLKVVAGISVTGATDTDFNVTNAYIVLGNTSSSNKSANAMFGMNFTNSIVEFTNQFTLSGVREGYESLNPVFNVTFKDSVVTAVAKLCFAASGSNVVVDNSNVKTSNNVHNSGELTIKNGSTFEGGMIQYGENGGNSGTITVDNASFTINNNNAAYAMDGKGVGSLILKNGAVATIDYIKDSFYNVDNTSTLNVKELIDCEVQKEAVAKIGEKSFETLDAALDYAKSEGMTEVEVTVLDDIALSTKVKDFAKVTFTGTNREQTVDMNLNSSFEENVALEFNDLTVSRLDKEWLNHYTYVKGGLEFNNCKMIGLFNVTAQDTNFIGCDFYNDDTFGDGNYSIWLYNCFEGVEVNITDCTFDVYERAIKTYGDGYNGTMVLNISGTEFVSRTADKTVVEMAYANGTGVGSMKLNITDSTATGFGAPEHIEGSENAWFNVEGANSNSTVTIDNTKVWPIIEPEITRFYLQRYENGAAAIYVNLSNVDPSDGIKAEVYSDISKSDKFSEVEDYTDDFGITVNQLICTTEFNQEKRNDLKAGTLDTLSVYIPIGSTDSYWNTVWEDNGKYLTEAYMPTNVVVTIGSKQYTLDEFTVLDIPYYSEYGPVTHKHWDAVTGVEDVPLPTATVTQLENEDLTFALSFSADQVSSDQLRKYWDWYADFELVVNGDVTFNANGTADGYLSGQYDAFGENWLNVPFDDVKVTSNNPFRVMDYADELLPNNGLKFRYFQIYGYVETFNCGVFLDEEFKAANPDFKVELALKMYDNGDKDGDVAGYAIGPVHEFSVVNAVAQIGDTKYTSLAEALKAVTDGATVELLSDITIDEAWDCRYNGAKITASNVTIDGKEHTLTINGDVSDMNWNTVFRFEGDNATVKNLTIDAAKATSIQRGISSKYSITVENCTLIGNGTTAKRGIIFGEVAGDALSSVTATITGSTFKGWSYGVSDNQSGKDAKSVSITGSTFENASVLVSAAENVTFTGNEITDGYANITSYTAADTVIVSATGNTLVGTDDEISVNPENITADDAFTTPVAKIGSKYYESLSKAFEKAADGDIITLVASIDLDEMIVNTKNITLDLGGKTITGTDTTSKNFSLIDNRGDLTITGNGTMTLTATVDSGTSRYSAVFANNPGGKLTIENGTFEHLGGTYMAYGIDNLTNGSGTYAETIVNGGTIKSTYRGIRQFLNGIEAQNILTVKGGTIEGANKSIWMQDPSANANTGTLTVGENANLIGDVYLFVTEGSTEWPVEVSIAEAALAEGSTVVTGNVPEKYELVLENGYYGVQEKKKSIFSYAHNLRLQDVLRIGFYIDVEDEAEKTAKSVGALVWLSEDYETENDFTVNSSKAKNYADLPYDNAKYYSFETDGIYAQNLDTEFCMIPYIITEDDQYVYGDVHKYSALDYATQVYGLTDSSYADLRSIVIDLVNYATAARDYFCLQEGLSIPEKKFNSIFDEADRQIIWDDSLLRANSIEEKEGSFQATLAGQNINLLEAISLSLFFKGDDVDSADYWTKEAYDNNADKSGTAKIELQQQNGVTNFVVTKITDLYSYNIYDTYYMRASNDELGYDAKVYGTSVAAYLSNAIRAYANSTKEIEVAMLNLSKAMQVYGFNADTNSAVNRK